MRANRSLSSSDMRAVMTSDRLKKVHALSLRNNNKRVSAKQEERRSHGKARRDL